MRRARERGLTQLGTLGSGNLFLQLQVVDEIFDDEAAEAFGLEGLGQVIVFFHCGSRGFGHQVCQDYLRVMERATVKYEIELPDKQLACAPINSPEGRSYLGAMAAAGEILVFVDADVVINADAISRAVDCLSAGDADAVFGSYVEEAGVPGFLNRFKNYQHHFVHQQGPDEPTSFRSECGAIKRSVFMAIRGFAAELKFCEDIEFGDALVRAGYRIRLLKQMQAAHWKHYSFLGLVKSDLLGRAIPWTRLLRSGRSRFGNLNTNQQGVASVALTAAACMGVCGAFFLAHFGWVTLAALAGLAGVNRHFLSFGARRRGLAFLPGSFFMLLVHYMICGVGYVAGHLSPR